MSRSRWLLLTLVAAAGAAAGAAPPPPPAALARAASGVVPADDPFPIRRVRAADPTDLLKDLEPGPVVRLPRGEFEERVRAAGLAVAHARLGARVADAAYTATLDGGDLVGTAEIGILNAHAVTGFVPLDPLRVGVRGATWDDGSPAVLAAPGGGAGPAVWVDRPGRRVLRLEWSLAGTTEPGERRFELRTPPCPLAALDLDAPADLIPAAPADVLLTGPFAVPGKPARRAWRLRFGGRAKAEFAVRAGGAADAPVRAKLSARYDLAPGQLTAAFEYDLHPVRGTADEWAFVADPALRITDVATNNRAGWSVDPPAAPGGPRRVRVRLRQAGPGGKVVVTAVAPFPDAGRPGAPLPAVRPLGAVLEEERLELRIAAGLKVDAWSAGDYRLADATHPAPGAADQTRVLVLTGALAHADPPEPFRRPPTVRAGPAEPEFVTTERLEWAPDAARSALVARIGVRVRRGPLFQLAVRPPPGYTVDRSAAAADEQVADIAPAGAAGYVVELARPLGSGQRADLRLEFRGPGAGAGAPVPFPAFAVAGAAERDGTLVVSTGPEWVAAVRGGAGAEPANAGNGAEQTFAYRGLAPDGSVTLTPARPAVAVDAGVTVDRRGADWVATTRLEFRVTGGAAAAAAVAVAGAAGDRTWKLLGDANALVDAVPVPSAFRAPGPLPGLPDVLAAVVGARAGADDTVWVLRFARPLAGAAVVETTATGPRAGAGAAALPVPRVLGATQTTRAEAAPGVRERAEVAPAGGSVEVRPIRPPAAERLTVGDAYLVTVVRGTAEALAAFGGTVRDGRGGALRVFLPAGAEVRGVCVAGRWLAPAACARRDPAGALAVPVPGGPAVQFEVRYRVPVEPGWPTSAVVSPVPGTDGDRPAVRRWWVFAAGALPGWPARAWAEIDGEPALLGGPLGGGEPRTLVARADEERVRVGAAGTADAAAAVLAAAMVVLGVAALRRRTRAAALLGGAVGGAVVVALVTAELGPPWWARVAWPPLVAATGALAVLLGVVALRKRAAAPPAVAAAAAAAAVLLGCASALRGVTQPAAPVTVLIAADAAGREEVLAARATLDRLAGLAKPPPPAPVVAAAGYAVVADGAAARVVATFAVHAFRAGDAAVLLPLTDARLERATVDGAAAFPVARPDGYELTVSGAGRHAVEVRFVTTVAANGSEREVRFGVPDAPAARLTAALPAAARQPAVVGRAGRQTAAAGPDRVAVEADLGGVRLVHLRWREGAVGAAALKTRAACVWDVTDAGAALTAAYLVRVDGGTVSGLRFDVPAELEVLRVAARTADPAGPVALRDWSVAAEQGGFRQLRLDFQAPAAGRLVAVLECAPRGPIGRRPALRFPRVGFGPAGEAETVYGLRLARVTAAGGASGAAEISAEAFKDFLTVPDLKLDPAAPPRAFRAAGGAEVVLRPALTAGDEPVARTATAWSVGPTRADGGGTVAWAAKDAPPLVEFSPGGAKVLEVRGADVAAWNQTDGRVQVWLRGPTPEGSVEWVGTAAVGPPPKPGAPVPFEPPHPRVYGARVGSDEVRVRAAAGWVVRPDRARGWQGPADAAAEVRFRTDQPAAPPRVLLAPAGAGG